MVVALTVTPALSLLLLHRAPLERRESPLVRWLQRGYAAVLGRVMRSPRPAIALVVVVILLGLRRPARPRPVAAARLQGAGLPDALGDQARHLASRRRSASPPRPARSCGPSPASATSAPTSARPCSPTRWSASTSARTGSASTPTVDYDKTLATVQEVVDGYPGLRRDVQTYLKERIREVLTGGERGHRRPHLRPRPRGPARQGRRGPRRPSPGSTASSRSTSSSRRTSPRSRSRSTWPRPRQLRPQAGRRAPGRRHPDGRRGGRRHLPRRQGLRRPGVEHAGDPPQPHRHPRAADRHPRAAATCAWPTSPTVTIKPTPNAIDREAGSRKIDVGANVRGRDLGSVVGDVEDRLDAVEFPLGYSRRAAGRVRRAPGGHPAPARLRRWPPASASCSCWSLAFRSWRLAPAGLPDPADGPGRRAARRPTWAAASSRSARWSASSPCSASWPATASC